MSMYDGGAPNFARSDWRMPTWKEILSLVDRAFQDPALTPGAAAVVGACDGGATTPTCLLPFQNVDVTTYYWTSTTQVDAFFMYYGHSETTIALTNKYDLWAVSGTSGADAASPVIASAAGEPGVQWDASRFVANGDGTVTDTLVGRMWTQSMELPGVLVTWSDALAYAQQMNAGTQPRHRRLRPA